MAEVQLEVRWDRTSKKSIEAQVETPDGQRHQATSRSPGAALFLALVPEGRHVLHVQQGSEHHRLAWTAPPSGRVLVEFHGASAGGERFQVEIDDRPVFGAEMVVTPRKRRERALDLPMAITTLDGDSLELRSARDLSDVGDYVPNVDFSVSGGAGGAPSEATVYIRGVGQIEPGIFADPGIGIYVDGMYIARSQGAVLDLLDVERIEVLRGPQGTLFGKNSTGGAISLLTRRPSRPFKGRLRLTGGRFDRFDALASLEGPLSDQVVGSFAVRSARRDGYTRSLSTRQTFNDDDRWSARGALSWRPNAQTRIDVTVDGLQEREAALDQTLLAVLGSPLLDFYNGALAGAGQPVLDERFITGDLLTSYSDFPSFNRGDVAAGLLRVHHTGSRFDVLSITGYRQYEYRGSSDFDGSPIGFFARSYIQEQDQLSQEIQLTGEAWKGRLQYTLGGLYFEENPVDIGTTHTFEGLFEALEAAPGAIFGPPGSPPGICDTPTPPMAVPCFGGAGNPNNRLFFFGDGVIDHLDIETDSWALFGEGSLALNERLSLSAGVRTTYERKAFDYFTSPQNSPDRELFDSESWEAVSPRLAITYRAAPDVVLYASASHGFKSGGFNAGRSLLRAALNPYDQESVWAYEGGFKGTFADRRFQATGSTFHYDYQDIQFATFLFVDGDQFLVIQNAAESTIQGVELDLEARLAPGLNLNAAVGYIDTEYTDLSAVGGAPQDGVIPKTPQWTLNGSLQYAHDLGRRGSLLWRADAVYKSDYFNDVANSPSVEQEAYTVVHGRIVYAPPGDTWEMSLFGTNLGNTAYLEHGFAAISAGQATGIAGRPREWGVSLQYRF